MNAPREGERIGEDGAGADRACPHGHGSADSGLAGELRALVLVALDRLDPLLARLRDALVDNPGCPVCAVLAAVRADGEEPAGRFAAHAAGLAAALREALADRDGAAGPAAPETAPETAPGTARRVERIRVERITVEREPAAGRGTSC